MIKTIIQGEAVAIALARQQRWVDTHPDVRPDVDHRALSPDEQFLQAHRATRAGALETLRADHAQLTRRVRAQAAGAR